MISDRSIPKIMEWYEKASLILGIVSVIPILFRFLPEVLGTIETPAISPSPRVFLLGGAFLLLVIVGVAVAYSLRNAYNLPLPWNRIDWIPSLHTGNSEYTVSIEGCIETGNTGWAGLAKISNDAVSEVSIESDPYCPRCRSPLTDDSTENGDLFCDGCGNDPHGIEKKRSDAREIFESHIRRIVQDTDNQLSIQNLVPDPNDASPQEIWANYSSLIDDQDVSTNCFDSDLN